MPRFLVLDAYDRPAREKLQAAGASAAGDLYKNMLLHWRPEAEVEIAYSADKSASIADLSAYDAMFWTGSSLTIYHDAPEVTQQIDLAREAFGLGVPAFGSCWALQLACVAAGGACRKNPKGREFGLARDITLTAEGAAHPVFAGRQDRFMAFCSHLDEIETLPQGASVLAGNHISRVQAAEIRHDQGVFFAQQYHPEYDFSEIAALSRFRAEGLIDDGFVADEAGLQAYIADCQALSDNPRDADLRAGLQADDAVLDQKVRQNEVSNWLDLTFPKR